MSVFSVLTATEIPFSVVLSCGVLVGITLLAVWKTIRQTTLIGPWFWVLTALILITGVEILANVLFADSDSFIESLRFVCYGATLCPVMALLGAKRPQHLAWQAVVVALWLTLTLPAVESMFRGGGRPLEVHGIRTFFLMALLVLGPLNALGTRYWPTALLLMAGQIVWFAPWLPLPNQFMRHTHPAIGWVIATAAVGCFGVLFFFPARRHSRQDRTWFDFRDCFGVAWSLRVMDRVNATAEQMKWPIRLSWNGFVGIDGKVWNDSDPDIARSVEHTLRRILWRFVSDEWLKERC